MSHKIVVTELPNETRDDPEFTIQGDHDFECETWRPCTKDWHRHPRNLWSEMEDWSTKRVPEYHQWLDGEWCVRDEHGCGVREAFARENYDDEFDRLGTYWVKPEWDGTWWLQIKYAEPQP